MADAFGPGSLNSFRRKAIKASEADARETLAHDVPQPDLRDARTRVNAWTNRTPEYHEGFSGV